MIFTDMIFIDREKEVQAIRRRLDSGESGLVVV